MKQTILSILLSILVLPALAVQSHKPIHILPDAPSSEYVGHYTPDKKINFLNADGVAKAVKLGERNMAWLSHMNSFRADGSKLQLTKPGDLKGIPIEEPKAYNAEIVTKEYNKIESEMPAELKAVLYTASNKFPENPPTDEATYVEWAKKVDKNYQTAVRWKMMLPWLSQLEEERQFDLRGYYFLSQKTTNVESFLRSFDTLDDANKEKARKWLTQMCTNEEGLSSSADCTGKVKEAIQGQRAYEFYLKYLPHSEELWNSYFSLHNPRSEVVWTKQNPLRMTVPFMDPQDSKILDFLKINIEDEWKWDGWKLLLDFKSTADIHVEFQPGVTPHVNGLGGNTIVMDKNTPLTEWDVQWTIRHEFGHVLGFNDCYLEFYESETGEIISYQLDIENLMCARSGRMQQTHYETLKDKYLK